MKIIIMNCSREGIWYKNKIGKTYTVQKENTKDYIVTTKDAGGKLGHVLKQDAEVIEK
ncbi:hypothetical protein [Clostridium magnum]|uniref:Uncharacterized protein n=1 Tax=Clostridium magnum DSM 2767 TaxID=1121326 RepID=A0A161XG34_9CLOT|nr:hypothetical protein [Clostridium magnum]KZL93536.1 hypothetical protein CLMAG_05820 [Clostridium magnum DSM 2767]SHI61676.1 hypothetical protein SAMN02745944_04594 [Clostridium magnum DSM 2767]